MIRVIKSIQFEFLQAMYGIFIFLLSYTPLLAQNDTTYYPNNQILSITTYDSLNNKYLIRTWYPDGKQMANGWLQSKTSNKLAGDAVIYYEDGTIYKQYNHSKGILETFDEKGILISRLIAPVDGDKEDYFEYFTNGTVMIHEKSPHRPGSQGIVFYPRPQPNVNRSYMYEQEKIGLSIRTEYHPNGSKMHEMIYDSITGYGYIDRFYDFQGRLDTNTRYDYRIVRGFRTNEKGKYGTWYSYHPSGQLKSIENYYDNRYHGLVMHFYPNGNLMDSGKYEDGRRSGLHKYWYENGVMSMPNYYKDMMDGPELRFHPNGKLKFMGSHRGGTELGVYCGYDSNGILIGEKVETIHTGMSPYFSQEPGQPGLKLTHQGSFKYGLRDGLWEAYYPNGKKCYSINYRNGVIDGDFYSYDTLGYPCNYSHFAEGFLDGNSKVWLEKGILLKNQYYKLNRYDSIWTSYFPDGSIYQIEKFNYKNSDYIILEEWYTNGIQKIRTEDNRKEQCLYNYHYDDKGVLEYLSILNYDWKEIAHYGYYRNGQVYYIHLEDVTTAGNYMKWEYYDNGQLKSETTFINYRAHGPFSSWYANGHKKSEGISIAGHTDGNFYLWNEDGSIKDTLLFKNGVEVIRPKKSDTYQQCSCNKPPTEPNNDFMAGLHNFGELEKVNHLLKRFQLDTSYNWIFAQIISNYGSLSGKLLTYSDQYMYIDGKDGLRISLTPCRRGTNQAQMEVYYGHEDFIRKQRPDFDPEKFGHTPFEYFQLMADINSEDMLSLAFNYTNPYSEEEEVDNYSELKKFLLKNYNIKITPINNEEDPIGMMNKRIDEWYEKHSVKDPSIHFYKAIFDYFIVSRIKETDVETALNRFFNDNPSYQTIKTYLYGEYRVHLSISDFTVEIPKKLLILWDSRNNNPYQASEEKFSRARALFSVKDGLVYSNVPSDHIDFEQNDSVCFTSSEITGTGILISTNKVYAELGSDQSFSDAQNYRLDERNYPGHVTYEFSNDGMAYGWYAIPDDYLKNFMGLIIPDANLQIPFEKRMIEAAGKYLLIGSNEINGVIEIEVSKLPEGWDETKLANYLRQLKLIIHEKPEALKLTEQAESKLIRLYFTFKP